MYVMRYNVTYIITHECYFFEIFHLSFFCKKERKREREREREREIDSFKIEKKEIIIDGI